MAGRSMDAMFPSRRGSRSSYLPFARKTAAARDTKWFMTPSTRSAMTLAALPDPDTAGPRIDTDAAERAAAALLSALGADLRDEGLRETPRRMAAALAELLTPQPFRPTTFPNDGGYDELVVARSIPFHSLCMHHLLPFHGVAHI